ncbi:MAG: molecular chaperone DnaK, partial [Desulfovibrionaceae bacterium]|nr:molecular chaperone DnaK [Desulfovibrionaceae bacterium]
DSKVEELKKAMEGDDPELIKSAMDALAKASHKIAEQLYAQKAQDAGPDADSASPGNSAKADDDVVDADYTEVK